MSRSEGEKCNLGATLARLEEENIDLQRQVQNLSAQLAEVESQHAQRSASILSLSSVICVSDGLRTRKAGTYPNSGYVPE